jgi:hypothetical protein
VVEQAYRFKGGERLRPFSESVEVHAHSYSRGLERAISDFGADNAFGIVNKKLKEHYGITVPTGAARKITEYHAQQISLMAEMVKLSCPEADIVIAECDGSMIPIVETFTVLDSSSDKKDSQDRRKHKRLFWKEARLSMAHAKGSITPIFAGTMDSVEVAGKQLLMCVKQAGATETSRVHCVGDGAQWIANQVEEQFGANGTYLIDFYHLCEYLCAAAPHCGPDNPEVWLKIQKESMKLSEYQSVLAQLRPHLEAKHVEDLEAPVRACFRYIRNRPEQLNYKAAIDQELPIGSGEVESAHRYVLQSRLKLAGAWWEITNAKAMINLRTCRANDLWDEYWKRAS